ncbi:MAG: LysR family transcriptional regulator [Pigmentiphaga sp.]|uniref:LysR family transcriptional regulator n=1 Tax=Pigmentiphaga sp. TaxID=1977564 RepID=UPI0029B4612A|nr:LysR family transcriptional regulator [Pigmentiphaga sp.]MDX3906091.1 LysR family transcriptional regulator [Pigmentiphaga sp.]
MHPFAPFIRYFVEVARRGSVRSAADHLHVAPSAVTRQILKFEESLGVPLFERLPRGVRLTAAGETMLAAAQRLDRDFDDALAQIDALRGLRRGRVRIGILQYMSELIAPRLIADVHRRYPGISFSVHTGNSADITADVGKGELDMGMCWDPPLAEPVTRLRTASIPIGLALLPDHPLARRKSVRFRECLDLPLVLPARGMELRTTLDRLNLGPEGRFEPLLETNSIAMMRQMALDGTGVSVMTRISILPELKAGRLALVPLADRGSSSIAFSLHVRTERHLPIAASVVLELLQQRFDDYVG